MYFAEFIGDLAAEHMPELNAMNSRYAQRNGYLLVLVDASSAGTMTPAARRMSVEGGRALNSRSATAIFGTSLMTRTVATLLFKAVALLSRQSTSLEFFKTEAAARAWLDKQRARLRGVSS